jgi:putative spermidine/putrescine transport system permease protein
MVTKLLATASGVLRWLEWRTTWVVYTGVCMVFLLGPYLILVALSLSDREYLALSGTLSLRWYADVFSDPRWTGPIITSFVVAVGAAALAVALGVLAALGLGNATGLIGRVLLALFLLPAVLPTMIYSIAAYFGAASLKLVDTRVALFAHTPFSLFRSW